MTIPKLKLKVPRLPNLVPNSLRKVVQDMKLVSYENLPKILVVGGCGLVVVGTVGACKASMKHARQFEEMNRSLKSLKKYYREVKESGTPNYYTFGDYIKDCLGVVGGVIGDYALDMGIPVGFMASGFICIGKGVQVLDERLVAAVGLYNGLLEVFQKYRDRCIEENGEDADARYLYGFDYERKADTVIAEDGTVTELAGNELSTMEQNPDDIYTFYFREGNPYFDSNPAYNILFLINAQRQLTNELKIRKSMLRFEVVTQLGGSVESGDIVYPRDAMVGWKVGNGDGVIDLGIFDEEGHLKPWVRNYMSGHANTIPIRMNCDGNVLKILSAEQKNKGKKAKS